MKRLSRSYRSFSDFTHNTNPTDAFFQYPKYYLLRSKPFSRLIYKLFQIFCARSTSEHKSDIRVNSKAVTPKFTMNIYPNFNTNFNQKKGMLQIKLIRLSDRKTCRKDFQYSFGSFSAFNFITYIYNRMCSNSILQLLTSVSHVTCQSFFFLFPNLFFQSPFSFKSLLFF